MTAERRRFVVGEFKNPEQLEFFLGEKRKCYKGKYMCIFFLQFLLYMILTINCSASEVAEVADMGNRKRIAALLSFSVPSFANFLLLHREFSSEFSGED